MFSCDGYQVWQRVSKRYNIFAYLRTFKVLAQAIKFIDNIEKIEKLKK